LDTQIVRGRGRVPFFVVNIVSIVIVGGHCSVPFSIVDIVSTIIVKFAQGMKILVAEIFN